MIKFVVLFRQPEDVMAFENSYNDFLALVERMPDIQRRQVNSVLGSPAGPSRYYRVFEIYFEDQATMQASLSSPAGQEAGQELARFGQGAFEMMYAEVYEESGGETPQPAASQNGASADESD